MKILTHSYSITIFQNGKFCWKNHGWVEDPISVYDVIVWTALIAVALIAVLVEGLV